MSSRQPPLGLLMSMAIRYDHGLAMPGYYDHINNLLGQGKKIDGLPTHAQRLESTLRTMRQLWEEVAGDGFYSPEKDERYAAMVPDDIKGRMAE